MAFLNLQTIYLIDLLVLLINRVDQGFVKGAILCFRNPYFYFWREYFYSQPTHFSSQPSKDLNKVSLLLQDLEWNFMFHSDMQTRNST